MTGEDLKSIRHSLGLSVIEFGRALGYVGNSNSLDRTIRRYEDGDLPIPLSIQRLARLLRPELVRPYIEEADRHAALREAEKGAEMQDGPAVSPRR